MNIALTTQETLGLMKESLAKNVTLSTGLSAYDLQAPAKNLYPIDHASPQFAAARRPPQPRRAARWRTITSIPARATTRWAGCRKASARRACAYSADLNRRALRDARRGRHGDLRSRGGRPGLRRHQRHRHLRLLQKTMRKEETALLGGNTSLALGTPGTPTLTASGTGATLPAATYSVIVVALTFEGYRNSSLPAASRPPRRSPATTATPTR